MSDIRSIPLEDLLDPQKRAALRGEIEAHARDQARQATTDDERADWLRIAAEAAAGNDQ